MTAKRKSISTTFPAIGIGSSAGSSHALERFLTHMPINRERTFILGFHRYPLHHRNVAGLLQKSCCLPVTEARDGLVVKEVGVRMFNDLCHDRWSVNNFNQLLLGYHEEMIATTIQQEMPGQGLKFLALPLKSLKAKGNLSATMVTFQHQ